MEDSHAFVYSFGGVHGQGYFSIFDGHAGKHAAEWCGQHFHEYLTQALISSDDASEAVPDVMNRTYHDVDRELGQLAQDQGSSSGCTAVTCFLRLEDEQGRPIAHPTTGGVNPASANKGQAKIGGSAADGDEQAASTSSPPSSSPPPSSSSSTGGLLSSFAKRLRHGSSGGATSEERAEASAAVNSSSSSSSPEKQAAVESSKAEPSTAVDPSSSSSPSDGLTHPATTSKTRRVLYTANVGDARAVLCRRGHAVRLTYDHKASDSAEAKRITDAGGFVMNNRVNAVLAVTRSLGDSAMKEFVVGAPYTTETTLGEEDEFLIVACDGLWDVTDDQDAIDLVKGVVDPQEAAQRLLGHALSNFSTDNTSVMVVRFNTDGSNGAQTRVGAAEARAKAKAAAKASRGAAAGGESDEPSSAGSSEDSLGGGVNAPPTDEGEAVPEGRA